MKILYKILIPILLAVTIGLFGSTLISYEMSNDTLKELSGSLQKMAINNALAELDNDLEFNILNAVSLAQTTVFQYYLSGDPNLKRANTRDARDRIVNMRNTYSYVMLGIISKEGKILLHTEDRFIGQNVKDEGAFIKAMNGNVAIGNPYMYEGIAVYDTFAPVYSVKDGKIMGVVFNVSRLPDAMSNRMLLGDMGYLFVMDATGNVFVHKDPTKVFNQRLSNVPWGIEILENNEGEIVFTDESGREKLAFYDTLYDTGWTAVAVHDIQELEAPSEEIRNNSFFIAILVITILIFIVTTYIKSIVYALLIAVQYAEQVADGVLDKNLNLGTSKQSLGRKVSNSFFAFWYTLTKNSEKYAKLVADTKSFNDATIHTLTHFERNDELGVLYKALQTMVDSMRDMIKKADESNRMKSNFLANMSHEIRTPLNAVIGMAHLCLEGNASEEKKHEYLEKIQLGGQNLLGIINNILDVSKIEAGMFELEDIPFNLQEVCQHNIAMHQENARLKNLDLKLEFNPNMPTCYKGDPVRIGQILNNLIGNAIKFTEKGSVTLSCSLATEGFDELERPENTLPVCIQVRDTGIGISKEQEIELFKPFSQADTSITRRFGGTGLGLAISRSLAHLMHGTCSVQSELGQGTTFTFILSLEEIDASILSPKDNATNTTSNDFSAFKILVVEDNVINQLLMEELLSATKANVKIAENGKIAVDMVHEETFDIVLMDMQMPVMDGLQASREIRKTFDRETLPIIAVTANAMKEDKDEGMQVGLNDYITKPIDPKNLMNILRMYLNRRS